MGSPVVEGIPVEDIPEGDSPLVDKHPWDILPVDNLFHYNLNQQK